MNVIVIKCGGSVLKQLSHTFYENLVKMAHLYDVSPIIVHGGGPEISTLLTELNIVTTFVNGLRVTTEEVLDVAEMVLSGNVNKELVRKVNIAGGEGIGLSGVDASLISAQQKQGKENLGFVGEVKNINTALINKWLKDKYIPIISPIGIDETGQRWNINADLAASAIAKAFHAPLCMITNVPGIMYNGKCLTHVTTKMVEQLIETEIITGGMIPKVEAAVECLDLGIEEVAILDGTDDESLLKYAANEQVGTKLTFGEAIING